MNMLLLTWNSEVGISEVIAGLTFLAVIIGGIFALCQWRVSIKQKRAEYLNILLEREKSFYKIFLMFEYNADWYNRSFHGSGEIEEDVDGYLLFLNYVCYLKNKHILHNKDFILFFDHDIKRVFQNYQVKDYLHNIYCFTNRKQPENFTFSYLLDHAIDNNLIEDGSDFKNPNSKTYHHYLNY